MTLFAFICGAVFALTLRTFILAMADDKARAEILNWA